MAQNDGVIDPRLTESIWEDKAIPTIIGFPDPANPGRSSPAGAGNPLPVTVTNPGVATDVSALSKEATQQLIKALLQGTLAVSNASLPLPAGAATDAKVEAVRALLAGTLSVNPGTTERRAVISEQTLDLSAGTAVALPAPPNGATSLQIQPQGADVRLNVAGGTPTATSGLLFARDGIYDLYALTGVKLIGVITAAGVQAELIWRA